MIVLQYRGLTNGPFKPERRSTHPLEKMDGTMDGSAMSGPWSGRSYVGLKYSGGRYGRLWEVVVSGISFPVENGLRWSRSPKVCWAGVHRDGRRYSVGWSYFDRVWLAIQRKQVGLERMKITCFDWRTGILKYRIGHFFVYRKMN